MDNTLFISLSHQVARRRQMDIIANNIANMSTTAFKREAVMFRQYLTEINDGESEDLKYAAFVQDYGIKREFTDGRMITTGNLLDLALSGKGLMKVRYDTTEEAYTRNGHLSLSNQGTLITSAGYELLDENNRPIQLPEDITGLKFAEDGTISTPRDGIIAKLDLVEFPSTAPLQKIGDGLFRADILPDQAQDTRLSQGVYESSNVQPILEVNKMINVSRAYMRTAKLMNNLQDLQKDATNRITKLN